MRLRRQAVRMTDVSVFKGLLRNSKSRISRENESGTFPEVQSRFVDKLTNPDHF